MVSFTLTRKAKSDLRSIANYTQRKWNREQRRVYLLQLDNTFHMLVKNSDVGIECDFIKPDYRKFPVASHIVFYRGLSKSEIEIVRILHKRMDPQSKL